VDASTLPTAVYAIWWTVLGIVVVVIVPLAVYLLHQTLRAAVSIRRYLAEMLNAGVGIAGNTSSIGALSDTLGVAVAMITVAGNLQEHTGTIATALAQRAEREKLS